MNREAPEVWRLGLIGWPLSHSLSPRLHQAALRSAGLTGEYRLYPRSPLLDDQARFMDLLALVRRGEIQGLNVTIPHKQSIIPFLDSLTLEAQAAAAVNTIWASGAVLQGGNTDIPGFMADLGTWAHPPRKAVVLGAGGAARGVVYGLLKAGWQVRVAARRLGQAEILVQDLLSAVPGALEEPIEEASARIRPLSLEQASLKAYARDCTLIVNATPLGMAPDSENSPWPLGVALPRRGFLYDLVYNPSETALMRAGRDAGLEVRNGLGMLVEQAALSFEIWTGQRADRAAMRAAVVPD